jgi:prepilin-type processing-associated H-X9-DG protein
LKQIGIAMHNYHDTYKALPPAYIFVSGGGQPEWGWAVAILPFMEEGPLYDTLRADTLRLNQVYRAGAPAADQALLQTVIEGYRCPSDVSQKLANSENFGGTNHFRVAKSNYVACVGYAGCPSTTSQCPVNTVDSLGMFFGNSYLNFADCIDGLSNTQMVGERNYESKAATWVGAGANNSYGANGTLRTLFRGTFRINFDFGAAGQPQNWGKGQASSHPGGTNILLCDGSVRFLTETVNPTSIVLPLTNRADNTAYSLP